VATLIGACTATTGPGRFTTPSVSPAAASPSVDAGVASSIDLPWLPPQGVVVERNGGVVFIALDGRVLAKIHGLTLPNSTEAPGAVLLQGGDQWFELDVQGSSLRPIDRERADRLHVADGRAIHLPTPPGMTVDGEPSGHWRFALLAPDGNHILAQWSGECEIPTAYLFTMQAGAAVPVTGATARDATPESFALGWTCDDRALVVLPEGACGNGINRPGVSAYDVSGRATWVTYVPRTWLARMWGSR
jgi:hypothetical protein